MIHLTLPYPPTWNHLYGQRGTRKYMKKAGVEYKKAVAELVNEMNVETIAGRVSVFVAAYMPDKRRRDIMNLEKIVSDSLTDAGVLDDDSQIDELYIRRNAVTAGGSITIQINEI